MVMKRLQLLVLLFCIFSLCQEKEEIAFKSHMITVFIVKIFSKGLIIDIIIKNIAFSSFLNISCIIPLIR